MRRYNRISEAAGQSLFTRATRAIFKFLQLLYFFPIALD